MSLKTKKQLIVDDVISAIYAGSVEGGPNGNLKAQVKRVGVELGRRKAHQFTKRLVDSLAATPDDSVQLEALVVLGFAHPDVMRKHHIALSTEGRRLGVLLEREGRQERARELFELLCERFPTDRTMELELAGVMRRAGNTSELIERYMERAQEHMTRKETEQALPWLQEVLALDRSRKDVTRMIRDVRHHQANKVNSKRSNRRFLVAFIVVGGIIGGLGYREWTIHKDMQELGQSEATSLAAIGSRIGVLEAFRDKHRVFLGLSRIEKEIGSLESKRKKILEDAALEASAQAQALADRLQRAEDWRTEGLRAAELGDLKMARKRFEQALEEAPDGWKHSASLKKDIAAINAADAGGSKTNLQGDQR